MEHCSCTAIGCACVYVSILKSTHRSDGSDQHQEEWRFLSVLILGYLLCLRTLDKKGKEMTAGNNNKKFNKRTKNKKREKKIKDSIFFEILLIPKHWWIPRCLDLSLQVLSTIQQSWWQEGYGLQSKDHTQARSHIHSSPHLQFLPHLHSALLVPWITAHVVQHCSAWERSQLSISKLSATLTHQTPDKSCNRNQTAFLVCTESLLLFCPALNITLIEWSWK